MPEINTIHKILTLASYAPSVHNMQPWQFRIAENGVTVEIAKERLLAHGDPVNRETWISIGACVETIVIAAASLGIKAKVQRLKQDQVHIELKDNCPAETVLLSAITKRFSDRSLYTKQPIPRPILQTLQDAWKSSHVRIVVTSDEPVISNVAQLTAQGMTLALTNKQFRSELSQLINRPLSRKKIGFSSKSLRVNALRGYFEPWRVKSSSSITSQVKLERKRIISASALVLIFSKGDTPEFWVEVGRAYQRAGLTVAKAGLRQATTAAVVEAADFHTDIEQLIGTKERLQAVMRIGYSNARPVHSKRLPLEQLLTT
jgi:hypothetical protein